MWTWSHLGVHAKPCAVLEVAGFWRPLLDALDHMTAQGFIRPDVRALLLESTSPEDLFTRLATARTTPGERWLGLGET